MTYIDTRVLHGKELMDRLREDAEMVIEKYGIDPQERPELFHFPLGYQYSQRQLDRLRELGCNVITEDKP